ncbi:MAG: hypothetical protein JKY56_02095 [Kofleriaceae bacterium]|nr:hypothetical protein [Kofleriaceae bacterium]
MSHTFRKLFIPIATLLASACGGGGSSSPDAGAADAMTTDGGGGAECAEFDTPATTISTYPNTFDGNLVGAGADHNVAEGICTDERSFFDQAGEDQIIRLDNLTAGQRYAVIAAGPVDLGLYIVDSCSGAAVAAGECLAFADETLGNEPETLDFIAPASGTAYVVVDHFASDAPILDGTYSFSVLEAECVDNSGCSGATPTCSNFTCVECVTSFECGSASAGVCDTTTNTCIASFDDCTNDDSSEPADDSPLGATVLADPTESTPTVVSQSICNAPLAEADFFQIEIAADTTRVFSLDWSGVAEDPDIDIYLLDSMGVVVNNSFLEKPESIIAQDLPAGTYFVLVNRYDPTGTEFAEAVGYTLTVSIPECSTNFDCTDAAASICSPGLACVAGPAECTGDDANEDNDGPAAATQLTSGVAMVGAICNTPASEVDLYKIAVSNSQFLDVELAFDGANMADIDVRVLNAQGDVMGMTFWSNPENVNLSFLPAGDYLIEISYFSQTPIVAAHAYTLTATTSTPLVGCTAETCDDQFRTQNYRGTCNTNTGACTSIAGAGALALDAACDSNDDCTSGICSYLQFQQGAANSVCTVACTATSECTTAHGAGFSCTVPLQNNFCHPDCGGDLDCGANLGSAMLDANEPWDYLVCTAGVCDL